MFWRNKVKKEEKKPELSPNMKIFIKDMRYGIAGIMLKYAQIAGDPRWMFMKDKNEEQKKISNDMVDELVDWFLIKLANIVIEYDLDFLLDLTAIYHDLKGRFEESENILENKTRAAYDFTDWYFRKMYPEYTLLPPEG